MVGGELYVRTEKPRWERKLSLLVDKTPAQGGGDLQFSSVYMLRQNRGVDRTAVNGGELCSAFRLYRAYSQWFCLSNSALSYTFHLYGVESQWKKLPYLVPASFLSEGFLPCPVLSSPAADWQSVVLPVKSCLILPCRPLCNMLTVRGLPV